MISKYFGWVIPVVLLVLFNTASFGTNKKERPNFLFILADDQCYNTIRALGNSEIITPTLDKLVEQGVTFTHTYNMGAWNMAVCVPSRTMLQTGRMLWKAYNANAKMRKREYDTPMWSQLLKGAGYDTYMTGKWHIKQPIEGLYDTLAHIRSGMPRQTPEGYNRPLSPSDTTWKPWDQSFGGYWEGGIHWSDITRIDAVNYIETASEKNNPFFMFVAFNAPHDPRQAPRDFVEKYPLEKIQIPESFIPEYPYRHDIGLRDKQRDERLAPYPRTEYAVKVHRQEYYASITYLDKQIGEIINSLEKSGKLENTYIIFSADHGLAVGNHGMMGKQNLYDHSVRVPLIISGKGLKKNIKKEQAVYMQDIMPTVLELAGIDKPDYVDFNSIWDLATGERVETHYPYIYGSINLDLQRSIRSEDYKLIIYPKAGIVRLYNVKTDPLEINDLSNKEEFAGLKKKLFEEFKNLQRVLEDPLTIDENIIE